MCPYDIRIIIGDVYTQEYRNTEGDIQMFVNNIFMFTYKITNLTIGYGTCSTHL